MHIESSRLPEGALANVAYLARSKNRVAMLDTLTTGIRDPRDLATSTGISRQTARRIVTELEERGWVKRTSDGYTATAAGERAVSEFMSLVGAMQTIRELDELVDCIPAEELSIGLHQFADATIRAPASDDPMAGVQRLIDLTREASNFRCLVHLAPPIALEQVLRDGIADGRLVAENIITADELAYLRQHPDRMRRWQAYLAGGADVYCYDGHIPCNVFIFDSRVLVSESHGGAEQACTFIETQNEAVRAWAHEVVERYREQAERISPEVFTSDSVAPVD